MFLVPFEKQKGYQRRDEGSAYGFCMRRRKTEKNVEQRDEYESGLKENNKKQHRKTGKNLNSLLAADVMKNEARWVYLTNTIKAHIILYFMKSEIAFLA